MPLDLSRAQFIRLAGVGSLGAAGVLPDTIDHRPTSMTRPLALGAWSAGMDADPTRLDATARALSTSLTIASIFRGKGDTWPYPGDRTLGARRTLLVSWSLEDWGGFAWWAAGHGDAVLLDQAARLKAYPGLVAIRPWAEMNGDWAVHQVRPAGLPQAANGGTPTEFVAAWRHVVSVFRDAGVTNVRWVFNPTTDTYAGTTDIRTCFPGPSYVDVLGLDGYNWGTGAGLRWRSFDDIFRTQYERLTALAPTAPVWICEIGCADPTTGAGAVHVTAPPLASKGRWWRDAFVQLAVRYPRVRAVVLFDAVKERDWRVASSASALDGLRAAVHGPGRVPALH